MVSTKPSLDYYEILGLPRDASQSDIGAAFRARILAIRDQPGAGDESRRINLAYRALNDPDRRRDYDEALIRPGESTATPEPEPEAAAPPPPPPPPPPPLLDEPFAYEEDDQPERSGTGRTKLVSVAIAMLLLLLAGAWAGGLLSGGDPRIASRTGEDRGASSSGEVGVDPAAERGGNGLADAIAALTGREEATRPAEPLQPGIDIANADVPPVFAPGQTLAEEDGTGSVAVDADEAPAAPASETDQPVAEAEPETASPGAEEPSPPPAQADPTPPAPTPPPPPVDQSAGPRLLRGGLNDSDNRGGRFQGTVGVRITVGANGRPQGCRVVRSSGNRGLDGTTCYLLEQRLVFSPARNRDGAPIQSSVESNYVWGSRRRR